MLIKILVLCSALNVGDIGHSNAVLEAMSNNHIKVEKYAIDVSKPAKAIEKEYREAVAEMGGEKYITFAVGEKGMDALNNLNHSKELDPKRSYTALGIHQYFETISRLPLNYISIPEATLSSQEKKDVVSKIPAKTTTFAVPTNNPTPKVLKESYDNWKALDKPPLEGKYIIVMLPGDAPDQNNKMQYYSVVSNKTLFNDVYKLWKKLGSDYKVIVQNGPRTGKHDPSTGQVACAHEYKKGGDPKVAVDKISQQFIDSLRDAGVNYSFYNFAFELDGEKKKSISVANPLLYLSQNSDSYFVLPGESVSMVGQIPLYIESDRIIVFKPDSMNSAHRAIFDLAVEKSYISSFKDDGSVDFAKKRTKRQSDDAVDVAKDLISGYNRFLKK